MVNLGSTHQQSTLHYTQSFQEGTAQGSQDGPNTHSFTRGNPSSDTLTSLHTRHLSLFILTRQSIWQVAKTVRDQARDTSLYT